MKIPACNARSNTTVSVICLRYWEISNLWCKTLLDYGLAEKQTVVSLDIPPTALSDWLHIRSDCEWQAASDWSCEGKQKLPLQCSNPLLWWPVFTHFHHKSKFHYTSCGVYSYILSYVIFSLVHKGKVQHVLLASSFSLSVVFFLAFVCSRLKHMSHNLNLNQMQCSVSWETLNQRCINSKNILI